MNGEGEMTTDNDKMIPFRPSLAFSKKKKKKKKNSCKIENESWTKIIKV